jgi:membrane protein
MWIKSFDVILLKILIPAYFSVANGENRTNMSRCVETFPQSIQLLGWNSCWLFHTVHFYQGFQEAVMRNFWQTYSAIFKEAIQEFMNDNAIKLSASLSYYTLFSLAPMLLVVLSIVGFFYGREAVEGQLYNQIDWLVGAEAAKQVQELIRHAQLSGKTGIAAIIGVVTLIIGATGVFAEIQDSINQIWAIKPKPRSGLVKYLINRLLSFSLIVSLGFLFIVSLLLNTVLTIFSEKVKVLFSDATVYLFWALNIAFI